MALTRFFRKNTPTKIAKIEPNVASSAIILAYPGYPRRILDGKLKDVSTQYDLGHRFRDCIEEPGFYSEQLADFLGNLRQLGLLDTPPFIIPAGLDLSSDTVEAFSVRMKLRGHMGPVNRFSLTDRGMDFLEDRVLYSFCDNPEKTLRFVKDCGLDTNSLFQKHITRYLENKDVRYSRKSV